MKIAIILSGQLRNFNECFPSLKDYILDHNDCHIYMHTYLDTNPQELQQAVSLYQPQRLLLERPEKDFSICDECGPNREPMYWMWRNVQIAFRLVPTNYECVVKARYDIQYTQPIVFTEHDITMINIPSGGNFLNGINDLFAFSSPANMEYYCSMIDYMNGYASQEGITCHPETLLKYHLRDKQLARPKFPIILRNIIMTDHYPDD